VYDQRLHELGMTFPDYAELCKAGAIRECYSMGALAAQLQLPAGPLEETLYNVTAMQAGELRDPFGRDFTGKPALRAPYYAVKVTGALFHTQGGLEIDVHARVLRGDGSALPNLRRRRRGARHLWRARMGLSLRQRSAHRGDARAHRGPARCTGAARLSWARRALTALFYAPARICPHPPASAAHLPRALARYPCGPP